MFRMKAVVGVAFRPMLLGKCWMAESAELSSLFDDSCFKISVSEAVFPNYFRIKLNVRSLNMRQTQHCLHFSIALNVCQRHTELRAFVSWCASWQAPTPSSWISRCQPSDHWKIMALTWTPSPPWLPVISVQAILSVLCFVEYLPNLHMNLTLGNLSTGDGASMAPKKQDVLLPARAVLLRWTAVSFSLVFPLQTAIRLAVFW